MINSCITFPKTTLVFFNYIQHSDYLNSDKCSSPLHVSVEEEV